MVRHWNEKAKTLTEHEKDLNRKEIELTTERKMFAELKRRFDREFVSKENLEVILAVTVPLREKLVWCFIHAVHSRLQTQGSCTQRSHHFDCLHDTPIIYMHNYVHLNAHIQTLTLLYFLQCMNPVKPTQRQVKRRANPD